MVPSLPLLSCESSVSVKNADRKKKDLSKACDSTLDDLLFVKLPTYGFACKSLQFLQSYFCNRKQRTMGNDANSTYCKTIYGALRGSV